MSHLKKLDHLNGMLISAPFNQLVLKKLSDTQNTAK